jgi:hypothetical protein
MQIRETAETTEEARTCADCGAAYDASAWHRLAMIERLTSDQVTHLVTAWPWPREIFLEVRRCPCGASLVRRRRAA